MLKFLKNLSLAEIVMITIFALVFGALYQAAYAQTVTPTAGTVTVTATPASGKASVTPTITWSTTPAANSCVGSGGSAGGAQGWSATLAASGTYTPPVAIITSQTYTVTCTWTDNSVTLSWNAPTQNTDGTPLTDLASYNIYEGASSPPGKLLASPLASAGTTYTASGLPAGTNYFAVTAVNSKQQESELSNIAAKATAATAAASTSVTVTVVPAAPTLTAK